MNDDDRLTPEERAVIDAALAWQDMADHDEETLSEAVTTYRKATAPPEPFEEYIVVQHAYGRGAPVYVSATPESSLEGEIWRCTVTPIERVR